MAGNKCTASGLAGACLGGARYAGLEPLAKLNPLALLAETRTKYGCAVCSSVIVYQSEEAFVALLESTEEMGAGIVDERTVKGERPLTEVPKSAVKLPLDPL